MVPWHARFGGFVWDLCLVLMQGLICVPAGHGIIPLGLGLLVIPGFTQILFCGGIVLMALLLLIKVRWLYVVVATAALAAIVSAIAMLIFQFRTNWYDGKLVMFIPFLACLIWRGVLIGRIALSRE
jgi:hypothetical protein